MSLRLSILLMFMFPALSWSQQDLFQTGYGGPGIEKFTDVEVLPSGGFLATGYTTSFGGGGYDVLLMRMDSNGDQLWSKTIGTAGDDFANCMTLLNDGSILIAGTTESFTSPGQPLAFASRLDSAGNVIWFETFRDSLGHYFNDVTVRADNSILLAGMTFFTQAQTVECNSLIVIDTNGTVTWSKKFTVPSAMTQTTSVAALPGGSVIAAGRHYANLNDNGLLMRITPTGTIGWSKVVNPTGNDLFYDVCYAGGKRCAAVGATTSVGAGQYDVMLTLFDTTGIHTGTRTFGTPQSEYGYSIISCADGGFAITGITEDAWSPGQFDPFILRTDSLGNLLWMQVLGTPYPDVFSAMNDAGNGKFIVCGSTQGLGQVSNESAYVVLTDSLGQSDCNSIPFQFQTDSIASYSNVAPTFIVFAYALNYRTISSQPVPVIETYPLCITGVADAQNHTELLLYPLPAASQLTISGIREDASEIRIYNLAGELLLVQLLSETDNPIELDVSNWSSGLYFLAIRSPGDTVTKKFMITSQ